MINKSQIKRILSRVAQMAFLLAVLVGGGFLLPMYTAHSIFSALSITPLSSQSQSNVSVSIRNRNVTNGGNVQFSASSPTDPARITAIQYSCEITDVTLLFMLESGAYKQLPCGTSIQIPTKSRQQLQVKTSREDIAYLPLSFSVASGGRTDTISSVIATSFSNVDRRSSLSDQTVVTFEGFGQSVRN